MPEDDLPPRIPSGALCSGCNYSLRELTVFRCPECGRPFDPADRSTMNLGRPLNAFARRLIGPSGRPTTFIFLLPCVGLLYLATDPAVYYMALFALLPMFWVVLVIIFFLRLAARAIACSHYRQPRRSFPADRARGRVLCAAGVLTTALFLCHVPLRVAFIFARPGLERALAQVRHQPTPTLAGNCRAGPYRIISVRRPSDDILLFSCTSGGEAGFAYSPNRSPAGLYNSGTHGHLWGPWYWVAED